MKALSIDVYRNGPDCSLKGISSKYDSLLLPCDEGCLEVDENDPRLLRVVHDAIGKGIHLEPYKDTKDWVMFGGNFAYCSDSRLSHIFNGCALRIHDRIERYYED